MSKFNLFKNDKNELDIEYDGDVGVGDVPTWWCIAYI